MSFGITELMIILVIVLLLFGTKKLRSIGTDLGGDQGFRAPLRRACFGKNGIIGGS